MKNYNTMRKITIISYIFISGEPKPVFVTGSSIIPNVLDIKKAFQVFFCTPFKRICNFYYSFYAF